MNSTETGEIRFYARPRVELTRLRSFSDVQKLAFTLAPQGRPWMRRVHVGRKRMPDPRARERAWAYVDRIGRGGELVAELLASRTYETKSRGVRRQNGAIELARGTYAIATHGEHAHLLMRTTDVSDEATESLLAALRIVPTASYIAAVFNPEKRGPDPVEDVPFREPSIYDDDVMERFGRRRFAPLEPVLLDREGAELLLIGDDTHCSASRSTVEAAPLPPRT